MMKTTSVLAAGGDVGGARALLPALRALHSEGVTIEILDRGVLAAEAPGEWMRRSDVSRKDVDLYVFGTSLHDRAALSSARAARDAGIPVVCVLDNWMNYRRRLEMDGGPLFIPDAYAVMDELAREEAVKEGVPDNILYVTGHPGLAKLAAEYKSADKAGARSELLGDSDIEIGDRKLVVFVSEPAKKDQGADPQDAGYRGYTEETVFSAVCSALQSKAASIALGILPHPREDRPEVERRWNRLRGDLTGGVLSTASGRRAMMVSDGVLGMASLLLYEGMLLGKPVMSIQPNLRMDTLRFLERKGLEHFITDETDIFAALTDWADAVTGTDGEVDTHPELQLHEQAPEATARLILEVLNRR